MFVGNTFEHDSRVLKEATTLAGAGYEVRVIARGAPGLPEQESHHGVRVTRIDAEPPQTKLFAMLRRRRAGARQGKRSAAPAPQAAASPSTPATALGPRAGRLLDSVARPTYFATRWWRFAAGALRAARAEPADIYVAHDLDTLPVADRARRHTGGRLVYDSHEVYVELPGHSRLARRRWLAVERRMLPRVDRMFMSSPGHASVFARHHGVPPPPVIVNAPLLSAAPATEDVPDLRRELDLRSELPIVLYIGGIFPLRRLESLIEAAEALEQCAVVLMGPGFPPYIASLRALAEQRDVADRVRVEAPVPPADVVRYAAAADVGVIPFPNTSLNNFHGLPNKIFEYIMAGIPVVGSDFPQISHVIERYDTGRTFDPDDPGSFVRAVKAVLEDPERHAELRRNARAAARELNWEREARKLLAIFDDVAGHTRLGSGRPAPTHP
jgi:glycosyltransferase involved in cell wall biosynthesis